MLPASSWESHTLMKETGYFDISININQTIQRHIRENSNIQIECLRKGTEGIEDRHFYSEDGDSMCLRNVGSVAHIHAMQLRTN